MSSILRELARAAGIDPEYTTFRGETAASSDQALLQTLRALAPDLGIEVDRPEHALATLERQNWLEVVPPVLLAWDGALVVTFSVPAAFDDDFEIEVTTEAGAQLRAHGRLFDLPSDSHAWPGGVVHCVRRARLWLHGELGYHRVAWKTAGTHGEAMAIAAPAKAFGAPGSGPKRWGVFAPVYGLASPESGSAGDLGTLRQLFEAVDRRGGSYVATLPLLAAFLDEPYAISPYSPASRLYWNELYLDLRALAAQLAVPAPAVPPIGPRSPGRGLIDYRGQYKWRRTAIDTFADIALANPARAAAIDQWATAHDVYDYAAFRAIGEVQRASWRAWPAPFRDDVPLIHTRAQAIAFGADGTRIDSHVVAQWAMQHQLEALRGGSVSLYLDLPVGVSCDAYEVWRHRKLFLLDLAAGAPPDALFLGGQDWGLPPLSPIALRRDRYRYFIRSVRHHMRVAGMLRIDHVMGLFRLYCVPNGLAATDGVYIRYHDDELLAILTLESMRARCSLTGEDLGTVPSNVRPAMAAHGLYRLHVGQWCFPDRIGDSPKPAPAESVASLNTHDTATFAGWWRGKDIADKHDLGLIDDAQQGAELAERERQRAALLAFGHAEEAGTFTNDEVAMIVTTADLALGPAEVVLVALDDLALDPAPHNVPGTVTERPNWQRRVKGWTEALDPERAPPAARAAVTAVIEARKS